MATTPSIKDLNDTTPAASSGFQLGKWQQVNTGVPDPATGEPVYDGSVQVPNTGGVNSQTANYTAVAADCGKLLSFSSSSARTLTLPTAPPFPQWEIDVENAGTGTLFVAPGGSTHIDGSASSLSVTSNTGLRIKTDGTNYFTVRGAGAIPSSGYPGNGSLTIASAASPSTLNLTTEGTFDWVCPNGVGLPVTNTTSMKAISGTGFRLAESLQYVLRNGPSLTQNFGSPACSCTASDNLPGFALSGVVGGQGAKDSNAGGQLSFGFRLAVPAGQVSRTLRIYSSVFSGTATCTASLSDGSAATVTSTIASAAAANSEGYFTITFNAARDGQVLSVSVLLTTNLGSTPNVKFMAATLA